MTKQQIEDPKKRLRLAIWRRCRAWVEVYRQQSDGTLLIRSLLAGVENGVRRRTGTLPEWARQRPDWAIPRAFGTGQDLANEIPASLIAPFEQRPAR